MKIKYAKISIIGILILFISILIIMLLISENEFDGALVYPPEVTENMKMEVIKEFEKNNVPYKIKKGDIYYQKQHEQFALKVSDEVIFGKGFGPGMKFTNLEQKEYFIMLLEKEEILYQIKKYHNAGYEWVLWNINDDDKVKDLQLKFFEKIGLTKQPARTVFKNTKDRENLVKLLNEENIPHKIGEQIIGGNKQEELIYVEYDWKYFKKVKILEDRLHSKKIY